MTCKTSDANGLCVSILLNNMGWYLGLMGKLDNNEYQIYISHTKLKMSLRLYLTKHYKIVSINK